MPYRIFLCVVFLACLAPYLWTLNPAFLNDDSAETIAACFTLGIQHPPSYPLHALVGHLVTQLPLGGIPFRVNFLTACLALISALLLAYHLMETFQTVSMKRHSKVKNPEILIPALLVPLFLLFSKNYWLNALSAKGGIYMLQAAIILSLWYCLRLASRGKPGFNRWIFMAFLLYGAGLTNHWQTLAVFTPAFLWEFFHLPANAKNRHRPVAPLVLGMAFLSVGCSVLLYLPFRAQLNPSLDIWHPADWNSFLTSFFRQNVAFREKNILVELVRLIDGKLTTGEYGQMLSFLFHSQISPFLSHPFRNFHWAIPLLSIFGLVSLWRTGVQKVPAFISISLITLSILVCTNLVAVSVADGPWFMDNFLLSTDWIIALLAGYGLFFGARILTVKITRVLPVLVLLALWWPWLGKTFQARNLSHQLVTYDYGVNLMKSTPRNGILFSELDADYFTQYYFQLVENRRQDIFSIPTFFLFERWGVDQFRVHPELGLQTPGKSSPDPFHRVGTALSEIMERNLGRRPVCFSMGSGPFHRYYLSQNPALFPICSGVVGQFPSKPSPPLHFRDLRIRHIGKAQERSIPSDEMVLRLYEAAVQNCSGK